MSSPLIEAAVERIAAALERIERGIEDMAQSLQIIALRINARPNLRPVWSLPLEGALEFDEGTPKTVLLSQFVADPDPEYPGAKPLEINVQNVSATLQAMGFQVVDLGRDVEVRYDGRLLGAQLEAPVTVPNAFVAVADDGVPENGLKVAGG